MAFDDMLVSVYGRRLGMTSSGGVVFTPTTSTGPVSHAAEISSAGVFNSSVSSFLSTIGEMTLLKLKTFVNATAVVSSTLVNYGLSVFSSATATAATFTMLAPEVGIFKALQSMC